MVTWTRSLLHFVSCSHQVLVSTLMHVVIACSRPPATEALHTICGNNTSIVSSSWWWAWKCPKHVEQIISAIKHSVASSWFSSLCLYYDAWTNIHQILNFVVSSGSTSQMSVSLETPSDFTLSSPEITFCTLEILPTVFFRLCPKHCIPHKMWLLHTSPPS